MFQPLQRWQPPAGFSLPLVLLMGLAAQVGCQPDPSATADPPQAATPRAITTDPPTVEVQPPAEPGESPPANANDSGDEVAVAPTRDETTTVDDEPPSTTQTPAAPVKLPDELWDVSYIGGKKVGHLHTTFTRGEIDGQKVVGIDQEATLSVSRFGTPVTIGMTFRSRETLAGELQAFESTLKMGPLPNISRGVVKDRSLETTTMSLGKKSTKTLAWEPAWGGFFAVDHSLRGRPMRPGETRKLKALMPLATDVAVADVTLVADDYEMTELLDGKRELLKVKVTMKAGETHDSQQTVWTDRGGEVIKQFTTEMGGMSTYRTSREVALRRDDAGSFDLGRFSTVPVGNVNNAHGATRIVYRVKLKHANPQGVFAHCGSQQVKTLDEHTADVTVAAIGPQSPAELAVKPTPPGDDDLAANNLIQSDDGRVQQLAAAVANNETDPWQVALNLEREVYRKMVSKNFSTAFATAAEVARSLEGDCTEHAVLLAAMCRARKIPARVAIGLVYYPPQRGFAFHMWNEVWTGDRWVPLDATLGRGGIGAGHLKLVDSSLAGADSFSAFMPVAKVMGQLEIEVREME